MQSNGIKCIDKTISNPYLFIVHNNSFLLHTIKVIVANCYFLL